MAGLPRRDFRLGIETLKGELAMEKIKGFCLYYEHHYCFECDEAHREVIGWYKGEPNRETLMKLARKLCYRHLIDLNDEDWNSKVTVTDSQIIIKTPMDKIHYKTDEFELEDV